jgi:copper(I)-binding protein
MSARVPGRIALGLSLALVMLVAAACSSGSGGATGGISVTDAWVRVTTPDQPAAGYLTITNASADADALTNVSSPAFGSVQLHETVMMSAEPAESADAMGSSEPMASMEPAASDGAMGGMMGMQPVTEIPVPANGSVSLEPGGFHIMLMEPTGTLAVGDSVELTLTFRNADPITVTAAVKGA